MSNEKKAPEIRFDGFSEDWVEKKLSDSIEIIGTGKSSFEAKVARSERNKFAILGSRGVIGYDCSYDYSGNFILTARVGENAGRLYKYSGEVKITDNTVYIKSGSLDFNFYLLTKFDLRKLAFGTGQPLIKASELYRLKLFNPIDNPEKTSIGDYFQKLDTLINQHQHKHDKLSNLKKAMLEKMFPKAGETVPEIRFDGFSGEWEQVPFNEAFSFLSSNTLSRAELNYEQGKARNIHYGDILVKFGDVVDAQGADIPFISSDELVSKMSATKLQDGDVLFADAAEDASVGKCVEVTNVGEHIVFSGLHTIATRPNQVFASNYLGYYLNSGAFHQQLVPLMQGTKVLSISKKAISTVDVKYPSDRQEQEEIGKYFHQLDVLIYQHNQQITKLKNIKQACLDKMFV